MGFCSLKVAQNPTLPIIRDHQQLKTPMRSLPFLFYKSSSNSNNNYRLSASASTSTSSTSTSTSSCGVRVGRKWKEYQGLENWDGLLDPLDDNLRNEILRYGQFVDAAYKSFDFDPCSPSYASCLHSKASLLHRAGLPSTGYRVSKHLRATSGIRLPSWLHNSKKTSWIGYVAVCQDKHEIARLGRRDVVIALRGTATPLEWLENLRATLTRLPGEQESSCRSMAMVESGFLSLYTSGTESCPSLQEMVREEISRVVEAYGEQPLSVTITGHSLGAALATLVAYDIREYLLKKKKKKKKGGGGGGPMVTVISFGGPRVGNRRFRQRVEKQGTKVLRIVNSDDLITKMPGFVVAEESCRKPAASWAWGSAWWAYSEVGRELRLSSRDSPHLHGINVATCHHLNTYLHLVNGFVSSTCPFRSQTPPH